MSAQPTTMPVAATAGATPLLPGLPDEIVIWEILIRLPPKCLLRCRAVARSWRHVTSTRDFLLVHHGRQPSLPIFQGFEYPGGEYYDIVAFDHRAADAHLQPVARLDDIHLCLEASCDGLLVLSRAVGINRSCLAVCNPATRQLALLRQLPDFGSFTSLGMYLNRPTGEYRMLLHGVSNGDPMIGHLPPKGKIGCYVFALGSDQPPRYIGGPEAASALRYHTPTLVRDSLHWSPVQHQSESRLVLVFDTIAESFRQIRAPNVRSKSYVFEIDSTLGIYSYDHAMEIVDIWVLQNYEGEVWEHKHQVELPVEEIIGRFQREDELDVSVVSANGDVLLLLTYGPWLFYVNTDGKLVDNFLRVGQQLYACELRLKQTLVRHDFFTALQGYVPHNFFTALEVYALNASPFI